MHEAFDIDSAVTSHPIYGPVETPADINAIFDNIAYAKVHSYTSIQVNISTISYSPLVMMSAQKITRHCLGNV